MLHAQLFEPDADRLASTTAAAAGTRPAVLFTHGGCQRQMYAAMHYAGDYAALYAQNQYLASRGFVVLSVNYRGVRAQLSLPVAASRSANCSTNHLHYCISLRRN